MTRASWRGQLASARRAAGYVRPYRGRALAASVCVITQALLRVAPVLVFRALIDDLTHPHAQFADVVVLLGVMLVALLATGLASVAGLTLSAQIAENIVYDLRQELYERLIDQSVDYFTRRRSGEIISHLVNDIEGVERVLSDSLLIVLREACLLGAIGVLMFVLDWRLALVTLLIVPVLWVPFRRFGQVTYRAQQRVQDQLSVVTTFVHETLGLSGLMLVKAFSRTGLEKRRFAGLNEELRRRQLQASQAARWLEMGMTVLSAAGPIVLLLVGGLLVTQGSAGLGTVLAFSTILVAQLAASAGELGRAALACVGSLALWRRVFGVLDQPPGIVDSPGAIAVSDLRGSVTLRNVSFTYPGAARPALRDINVDIEPGQLVALVGPSGAGKSTFHALVARFMDPQSGSVALDGIDVRDLTLDSLHQEVGVVFQDTFLFHATLRENLRYGRPDASDEQIWAALRDANLDAVIRELPDGLDTMVGERGHRLSGGEKQRVAIARVLLKQPRVLLLDEATAHLDNVSERLIQAALHRLLVGRTALVIAHRLSTVLSADLILILERGRIVERGTHRALLETGGLYARLHAGQESEMLAELPAPMR